MVAKTIKQTELDFFECKLLDGKPATMYIRDGKMFIYAGDTKIEIDDQETLSEKVAYRVKNVTVQPSSYDHSKDIKVSGTMWFWQAEDEEIKGDVVYILSMLINRKKSLGIKFGRVSDD